MKYKEGNGIGSGSGSEYGNQVRELETEHNGIKQGFFQEEVDESGEVYTSRLRSINKSVARVRQSRNTEVIFENLTWLTSKEAAEYLRLPSVGVLRWLVSQRRVPFRKLGRSLRFKKSELDRLLEASAIGGL